MGVGSWAHIGRNGGGPYPQHPPHCRLSEGRGYCCRYLPHPSQRELVSGAGQEVGSMMGSGPRQSPLPRPASPPHACQTSRWPRPGRAQPGSRPLPVPGLSPPLPAPVLPGPCSMSSVSSSFVHMLSDRCLSLNRSAMLSPCNSRFPKHPFSCPHKHTFIKYLLNSSIKFTIFCPELHLSLPSSPALCPLALCPGPPSPSSTHLWPLRIKGLLFLTRLFA